MGTVTLASYLYSLYLLQVFISIPDKSTQDEVTLHRAVGLACPRGIGRGGGRRGDDVLQSAHRVLRRMKIEPSSGGEEIHLRRLREEIRGGSDRVQEEARRTPSHALPRRGGQLPKVD